MRGPPRFVLVIDVGELLSVGVAHDVVVGLHLGSPRGWEAAFGHFFRRQAVSAAGKWPGSVTRSGLRLLRRCSFVAECKSVAVQGSSLVFGVTIGPGDVGPGVRTEKLQKV